MAYERIKPSLVSVDDTLLSQLSLALNDRERVQLLPTEITRGPPHLAHGALIFDEV